MGKQNDKWAARGRRHQIQEIVERYAIKFE